MKRVLLILVVAIVGIYAGDYLWLRLRLEGKDQSAAIGSVTLYYATTMKNGRVEVFYDQPQTVMCVHSLFPHLGYDPCWYVQRAKQGVKQISELRGRFEQNLAHRFHWDRSISGRAYG